MKKGEGKEQTMKNGLSLNRKDEGKSQPRGGRSHPDQSLVGGSTGAWRRGGAISLLQMEKGLGEHLLAGS